MLAKYRHGALNASESHGPLFEPIPELRMIASEDDNKVDPSFGEDVTSVPVEDQTSYG